MEEKAKIEALLFVWGEPLSDKEIAGALKIQVSEARKLLLEMMEEYHFHPRGIELKKAGHTYQLQTKARYYDFLKETFTVTQKAKRLNSSTLETLAIIAYKQPVTRIEVEEIRGVKSLSSIETLLSRNLICECGRLDRIGKPKLYRTTDEFLRYFDLESLQQLPNMTEIERYLEEKHEN